MQELIADLLTDGVSFLVMAIGSAVFTGLGFLGEQAGLANVLSGDPALGTWEMFIGAWALFVGVYLLGYKQVLPRMRGLLA